MSVIALNNKRPIHVGWALMFIALATAILITVLAIKVIPQPHAAEKHGSDAVAIRKACDDKDPYQVWRNKDGKTFYQICQLPDERWGIRAIVKQDGKWIEKTAFVPDGDGSLQSVLKYLSNFATHYSNVLR